MVELKNPADARATIFYAWRRVNDGDEVEIVCRYPQFFAARLLKKSIIKSVQEKNGKGGTYFGATGCGKTYTMAFLVRQLALRCGDMPHDARRMSQPGSYEYAEAAARGDSGENGGDGYDPSK